MNDSGEEERAETDWSKSRRQESENEQTPKKEESGDKIQKDIERGGEQKYETG